MTYFLKKKKWMAWVVLLTFLFTSFMPTNLLAGNSVAEAADSLTPPAVSNDDGVTVSKTAVRTGLDTWEVTLGISGGSTETQKKTIDVVLVLDRSGSMTFCDKKMKYAGWILGSKYYQCPVHAHQTSWDENTTCTEQITPADAPRNQAAQNAANELANTLYNNLDNVNVNISVIGFGDDAITTLELTPMKKDNYSKVTDAISRAQAKNNQGTYTAKGLEAAYTQIGNSKSDEKYVILLTDGETNSNKDTVKSNADKIKQKATLYTVGLMLDNNTSAFLRDKVASKNCALTADNVDTLIQKFRDIVADILNVINNGFVTDTMGDAVDYVSASEGYPADGHTVETTDDKLAWNTGESVSAEGATLKYTVKLNAKELAKQTADNWSFALNQQAILAYADKTGAPKSITYPVPMAEVDLGYLNVTASGLPRESTPATVTDGPKIVSPNTVWESQKFSASKTESPVVMIPEGYELKDVKVKGESKGKGFVVGELVATKGTTNIEYVYGPKQVDYTIEYYYDGKIDSSLTRNSTAAYGTNVYEKIDGAVEVGSTHYNDQKKTGYKYSTMDVPAKLGERNNVIKVYYVKDEEQKHSVSYTVEYYKDGKLTNTEAPVTDTKWIMDGASVDVTGVNTTNYYGAGYKFVETNPAEVPESYSIAAGAASSTDNVIKVYYVKDEEQKHSVSYTVEYYKDGKLTNTEAPVTDTKWIMDGASVDVTGVNTTNYYGAGYKFVETNPAEVPESYSIAAGAASSTDNVIKVYYTAIDYKVTYGYEGTVPAGAAEQLPAATDKNHVNTLIEVATEPFVSGYTFSGWTVKEPEDITISDGTFTMPAHDVTLVGSWTLAGDTKYTVNYYYQNQDGTYGEPLFTDTLVTTTGDLVFADTTPNGDCVTTPSLYQFNPNAEGTVTQATVAADGTTVLNVYFDQVYRVVYKYTDGSVFNYVIDDTGYIFNRTSSFAPPMLNWDANTGADFDNVWYDNAVPENGQEWNVWDIAGAIASGSAAFDKATNTITLYTTAKVSAVPTITGQLNVAKLVNDKGNKTNGNEEFKFELKITEIKQSQVLDPLTKDEAEKLHHYNSENRNAQAADEKAQEDLKHAVEAFKGHTYTTASALSFVIADDNDISLYSVTTGSEMGWTSYDGWTAFDCQGDKIAAGSAQETVLNKIIEFIKDFAAAGKTMPHSEEATKMFMKDMMDYAGVATGSAITFRSTDLYELYDAAGVASMTKDAAEKKASALEDFLKEINRWIDPDIKVVIGNETYSLSKYKDADGTYTISFTLKDKETLGFDFKVTTGSVISYVISEVDAQDADSTDIKSNTGTEYVNKLFVEGSFEVTTDSFLGYTFTNNYNGSSDPVDPWDPWTPSDPDPEGPDIDIEDPDVPLAEPEEPPIEIEDPDVPLTDVPGEPIEIDEPEVPLGDAPKTGDSSNAIPFVVLMMVASIGLAITRRKFN